MVVDTSYVCTLHRIPGGQGGFAIPVANDRLHFSCTVEQPW